VSTDEWRECAAPSWALLVSDLDVTQPDVLNRHAMLPYRMTTPAINNGTVTDDD